MADGSDGEAREGEGGELEGSRGRGGFHGKKGGGAHRERERRVFQSPMVKGMST